MAEEMNSPVARNIVAAFKRGEHVLVDPMDYILLDNLVPLGTMFAGAYPDGPNTKELAEKLFGGQIPPGQVAPRLRTMRLLGLCQTMSRRGVHDKIWQVTPEGVQIVREWRERKAAEQ